MVPLAGLSGRPWRRIVAFLRRTYGPEIWCSICRKPIDLTLHYNHKMALTWDHVWAKARGGPKLDPRNLRPAHRACNSSKGARPAAADRDWVSSPDW